MKSIDIEAWVLGVVDQVNRNEPREDSRVELKAEWPDAAKAARQLAAHANAAGGEDVLWIVGLDESRGVVGADNNELANWYPAVTNHFDALSPCLIKNINVPAEGKVLVALLFSTERAPFVVRNSVGGPIGYEVPWREGCKTRSARREDLIRLLSPIGRLPAVEILEASISVPELSPASPQSYNWDIAVKLYVAPRESQRIVIPCHKCRMTIKTDCSELCISEGIWLEPRVNPNSQQRRIESFTVACTKTEAIIDGPGVLDVKAHTTSRVSEELPVSDAELSTLLIPAGIDKPISVVTTLKRSRSQFKGATLVKWSLEKDRL